MKKMHIDTKSDNIRQYAQPNAIILLSQEEQKRRDFCENELNALSKAICKKVDYVKYKKTEYGEFIRIKFSQDSGMKEAEVAIGEYSLIGITHMMIRGFGRLEYGGD